MFGRRMAGRFERRHARSGNVYVGVGLLSRCAGGGPVKGLVKGFESTIAENWFFPM